MIAAVPPNGLSTNQLREYIRHNVYTQVAVLLFSYSTYFSQAPNYFN